MKDHIQKIILALPAYAINNEYDLNSIIMVANDLYNKNWTLDDIISFLYCMEEVNPLLDEEIALTRMKRLDIKYSNIK